MGYKRDLFLIFFGLQILIIQQPWIDYVELAKCARFQIQGD